MNRITPCSQLLPGLSTQMGQRGWADSCSKVKFTSQLHISRQYLKILDRAQASMVLGDLKSWIHQQSLIAVFCFLIMNKGNTWRPNSRETFSRVMSGKLSMSVAILNASWASLKMCDEEWIFFWMDCNTVSSLWTSPAICKQNQKKNQNKFPKHPEIHYILCPSTRRAKKRTWGATGLSVWLRCW